jgi:hypothetical protein
VAAVLTSIAADANILSLLRLLLLTDWIRSGLQLQEAVAAGWPPCRQVLHHERVLLGGRHGSAACGVPGTLMMSHITVTVI